MVDKDEEYHNKTKALLPILNQLLNSAMSDVNGTVNRPPGISGIGVYTKGPLDPNKTPPVPHSGSDMNLNVILPAVGCFCFGILIASIIGVVVYRRLRERWKGPSQLEAGHISAENPKIALFQNDPLGDFFQNKEGTVSQDAQSALNFLATPFICNTFTNTVTQHNSARDQALFELQNEIDRETWGETDTDSHMLNGGPTLNARDIEWNLPDSDVIVNIPAGALPRSVSAQNSLKVALGANPLNVVRRRDQVQLSPLLILSSPNVMRFHKPVEVRIPHRAHLSADAGWTVLLRYSGTSQNNINKLEWSDAILDMRGIIKNSDVTYRYDTDFMYINTYVPGLFCAVGNGSRKQKPLKVAAVAFAYPLPPQTCEPEPGQETGNCGIDIKVFFVDYFREAIQHLQKTEEEAGGVCISQPLPLRMVNEKDWHVVLVSASTQQWPYRVPAGERVKVITTDSLYQNFGLGHSVEFQIFSKLPPDGGIDHFQATFSLAQKRRNPSSVVAALLTTQTLLLPRSVGSLGSSISHESDDSPFQAPLMHRELLLKDLL